MGKGRRHRPVSLPQRTGYLAMASITESFSSGLRHLQAGNLPQAEQAFLQVLQANPDHFESHSLLGAVRVGQGRHAEAVSCFREALRRKPDHYEAWCNLGVTLSALGRHGDAVAAYEQAISVKADYAEAHRCLGLAYGETGRFDLAEESLRRALGLKSPYPEALNNLGNVLRRQGRIDEAVATFHQALRARPEFPEAYNNLGNALQKLARLDEAVASYEQAIRLRANYPMAHYNMSHALLLLGDLARGWPEYEWRWKSSGFVAPNYPQPRWDGSPLNGRRVLLHSEQGLGDVLHFIRYAALVQERGGSVVFPCPKPLLRLLARTPGIDRLVPDTEPAPPFDVYAPLLSLPLLLGTDALAKVPATVPYVHPDPERVEHWRGRLGGGFKVGVAWQGDPKHREDHLRSVPLAQFAPLATVPGVRLISLQKGVGSEQLPVLQGQFAVETLPGLDEAAGPFMDTAAVMQHLDLVVTCDSAVAHLAGALGVPVWVVLPLVPDWRWMMHRRDTPWYPSMRLFRQRAWGDWASVFATMAEELQATSRTERRSGSATILVEVAPGELIDKITILEIKSERMTDEAKLRNVRLELGVLATARDRAVPPTEELTGLTADLKAVNEALWDIEDEIRVCERNRDFGERFVELARSVYHQNDRRAALKRQINEALGSKLIEEKSYQKYT